MNNKQLDDFVSKNGLKLAWFATSSGLLKGFVGTVIEIETYKTIEITECQFMSIESFPKCDRFTIMFSEIYGWGLA